MPEEPDNLVLQLLRTMRAEHSARFDAIEGVLEDVRQGLHDVRLTVVRHDLRFDALEERVEAIREGTVSAIGFAANASRAHVDLRRQIADLTRRVEKLETER
jgi:predicted  nucleic acid-binding Zn-ribbon protein